MYRGYARDRGAAHTTIADNDACTTQGLIAAIANLVDPPQWNRAVSEIQHAVCSNYYGFAFSLTRVDCFGMPYPEASVVCQVFTAYMNLAYERTIPEYAPGAHPATGEGSPYWPAYEGNVAVDRVAALTGVGRQLVAEILFELYWATKDRRVPDGRYIAPWTYRLHDDTLTKRPKGSDEGKNEGLIDFGITDLIRWGVILGVVGVGAYAVSAVVRTSQGVKHMFA